MKLPPLPKQNRDAEAHFGVRFRRWWEENKMVGNFELKQTGDKNYLNLSKIRSRQKVIGTLAGSKKGVLLRISSGTDGSPDYIGLIEHPSYIVIKFPTSSFIVPLCEIVTLQGKKSITLDDCQRLGRKMEL